MSAGEPSSYDEIPYSDNCFHYTHPDHMATLAALNGLTPPSVRGLRALELGCAMGGNLIPMAIKFPEARFIGVDLSRRQIDEGRAIVEKLGLKNLELRAASIDDVDEGWGLFDHIVCHGVYSWVPAPTRSKILSIFAENLTPEGLAYVSYNTYPGWRARGLARDMMAFHVRGSTQRRDSARQARAFLKDLVAALPDPATAYGAILAAESEFLDEVDDSYLYHEHLEETNTPVYFHQFIDEARSRGLAFLAEAKADGMLAHLPQAARERVEGWSGDPMAREQYVDFLTNRTFRRTFLCREEAARRAGPAPEAVAGMSAGALAMPESTTPDIHSDAPESFRLSERGPSLTTNHPLLKTALVELARARPRLLPFDELLRRVRLALQPGLREPFDEHRARPYLCDALRRGFSADLVALNLHPPRFAATPGERPVASPLARLQVEMDKRPTNLQGRVVDPSPLDRLVLRMLDGSPRDRAIDALKASLATGEFTLTHDDQPITDEDQINAAIPQVLDESLRRLAAMSLLVE